MNRELFVSATPHETRVGMVEDDQLAEIYLERENEYTLAGSIYKGRVTRVLPGMQSAFVDIGLERDAFLYVSDFMELEDSEDLDDVPTTNRPAPEPRQHARPVAEAQPLATEGAKLLSRKAVVRLSRRVRGNPSHGRTEAAMAEAGSGDAAAAEDAAASACRSQNTPGQPRRRLGNPLPWNAQNVRNV